MGQRQELNTLLETLDNANTQIGNYIYLIISSVRTEENLKTVFRDREAMQSRKK